MKLNIIILLGFDLTLIYLIGINCKNLKFATCDFYEEDLIL